MLSDCNVEVEGEEVQVFAKLGLAEGRCQQLLIQKLSSH